ncbi:MAG: hypothetical protein DRP14_02950 [Candidatus Aenigmatarchaeota archaeon]|nr:MAG: hypothetical protein DRP14_02950 [Candidatus Aenigmarchaeota archaeon]
MEQVKLTKEQLLKYYSNEKLQKILWTFGKNREVVARNIDGQYFKRPNMLLYPKDILKQVMLGAVSFHCSVERWRNPLLVNERNYDEQRIGFDWIIDIDSSLGIEEAKIAAKLVRDFLDKYRLSYFLKFSGRRGFHFCIFWENFPKEINYNRTEFLYPELPKILASFLRERIKDDLWSGLIKYKGSIRELTNGESIEDLNPFKFVEVEKDWSVRHLFRAPYSLHEKTGLVSILIKPENLENFKLEDAKIENTKFEEIKLEKGEATKLIVDAYDWFSKQKEKTEINPKREIVFYRGKITSECFPPCIQKILSGIIDGRKRSVFTLITFLRSCNWPMIEVEKTVLEWGRKVGLRDNYTKSQLNWHKRQNKNILPPNCENDLFYKDIGICNPLPLCEKIKNPINFAILKAGKKKRKK